jgi:Fe-S oxidoreductase
MKFDPFVVPFTLGLFILLSIFFYKLTGWINRLPKADKIKLRRGIFTVKSLVSVREVFMESLLHRKVFKTNPLLGFMHMSLAFGWFLLIIFGNIECRFHSNVLISPPYLPIFFKFFIPVTTGVPFQSVFAFLMDFLLLFVLTGVILAFIKRGYSKMFGMKKTTRLKAFDKLALMSLWLIFPLRLFAESLTAGIYHNGSFFTGTLGNTLSGFTSLEVPAYIAWWGYSISLALFFVALPFSRYMHIPSEVVLIFLRNYGIRTGKNYNSFSDIEVHSCSRCGICLDSCQLLSTAGIYHGQAVSFIQSVRDCENDRGKIQDCLMCGRCTVNCPVGIDINAIRLAERSRITNDRSDFEKINPGNVYKADVIYFAGCMTHLTPSIKKSMIRLFEEASENYWFMDKNGSICCGRPQILAGRTDTARKLMELNKDIIRRSGADTLVTSCPICYNVFKNDYNLNIKIMHHTEYLWMLLYTGKLRLQKSNRQVVYHDPCELGRGNGIFQVPRNVIRNVAVLKKLAKEKEKSLCCGGSLANLVINNNQRNSIRNDVLKTLTAGNPDNIITACPLCKKTFSNGTSTPVLDIAELLVEAINKNKEYGNRRANSISFSEELVLANR